MLKWFLLFSLQGLCFGAFSQRQNMKFEHLDINSGLSQNHIMCILQDSRGFMWFGTRDGLNKYDGYEFTIYKNDVKDEYSISNNFITAMVEDANGVLWIATRGGGVNRYDKEKDRFTRFKNSPADPASISSDLVTGLVEDKETKGALWATTENGGVNYFEPAKKRFTRFMHNKNDANSLSDDNTRFVFQDSEHKIWVGTYNHGLNLLDRKTKKFTRFRHDDRDTASLSYDNVRVIFEDSKRRLWIGTVGGGMDLFDRNTATFRHFVSDIRNKNSLSANVIAALEEDDEGNLWIGTENGGLDIYNPATGRFMHYQHDEIDNKSISHNSIYSIYKDADQNMWVGTFAGGVNIHNRDGNRFVHYRHTSEKNSLSHNNVLSITESSTGKLWIGTDGGGLNLFDPVTKNFTHFGHVPGNKNSICGDYVLSVCEDGKGNVWVGTWGNGLTVFNPGTNKYTHYTNRRDDPGSLSNHNVWQIFRDRENNIWVGTYGGGLNLYDSVANSFIRFDDNTSSIVMKQIYSITDDNNGNLLIGTDGGGLRVFNKRSRKFTTYIHENGKNSVSDDRINFVYGDRQQNFWLATMSGLNYFDTKKKTFTVYKTEDGLPNNTIFGIMEDAAGNLWISTNRGISRFNTRTKAFKNYGPADGLQSYEFKGNSLCEAISGMMYFGGINGFNEFNPGSIQTKNFEPPLVLTDFQVFNRKILIAKGATDPSPLRKDITETKQIILPYKSSVISFEFASLNYTVAEKKKYAYMLQGFDKDWNEIGTNRTATYTNLDPGTYIFRVKGLNSEGQWSTRSVALRLIITPPFWMTWWFRLTVLVGIAGSAIAFYRYRVNSINSQRIKLQQLVQKQTQRLQQSAEEEHRARQEAELANEELETKNKELEQFAFVASHDLQEPLRTTYSFAELLQKQYHGKLDEKADKYLAYILKSTDRMKVLIKDLLDYSRLGRKKEWEQVDCNSIVQEMLADLAITIEEKHADIRVEPLPVISGYQTELKLLFQNLVTNAIKFSKKEVAPQIRISAKQMKGYWKFSVQDNGIGMEQKHSDKIFIIFQRLHTRNQYDGSGIGLAHCKKIVELHGGKIWMESEPGKGSAFYFTLRGKHKQENKPGLHIVS